MLPANDPRTVCQAVFNNMAFANVTLAAAEILAVRPDSTVTTRQVAAKLGLGDSVVRPVMNRLVAAGMLTELPKVGPINGPRPFFKSNLEGWAALTNLITVLIDADQPASLPESRLADQQ